MRLFVRSLALVAAAAVLSFGNASLAQGPPPGPGTGEPVTIIIEPQADLVARLFVVVTVQVTCSPFDQPSFGSSVNVNVQQLAAGRFVVSGFGNVQVICDATPHSYEIALGGFPGPSPRLKPGPAAAQATYFGCGTRNGLPVCDSGSATQLIHISP